MSRTKRLPKVLGEEEQARFLECFNTRYMIPHRNLCLVRLMLEAGLRVGEAVALKPEHLDMRTCKLMVREGKGAKDRVLWIGDDLRDLVGTWLERRPNSPWLFSTSPCTQTGLFDCLLHPDSRGGAFEQGLVVGAVIGVPIGLVVGLTVTRERWEAASLSGSSLASIKVRPTFSDGVGFAASIPFGGR